MGACNFTGAVLGCVAVGLAGSDYWTDEDRANYREMVGDEGLSDDYVDECLFDNESHYIGEYFNAVDKFVDDLNRYLKYHLFSEYSDEDPLIKVTIQTGYYSGFELVVRDPYGFYVEQVRFLEAQAEDWAKYHSDNKDFTPEEWAKYVEKAIDFTDYALMRFAYNKELIFTTGGYAGGTSNISLDDVREFARFEKYGAKLALMWFDFCRKYGKEYNQIGL